jgi:hypothetical protein
MMDGRASNGPESKYAGSTAAKEADIRELEWAYRYTILIQFQKTRFALNGNRSVNGTRKPLAKLLSLKFFFSS